jgi:formylmethanofuran dehydrogenase subunit C
MLAVVAAVVLGVMVGHVGAQSGALVVGGTDAIGPAAISDWHTVLDMAGGTLTVYGTVQNRSNVTLSDVRVGLVGATVVDVATTPSILCPGEFGVFGATVRYGDTATVRATVTATVVSPPRFVPFATVGR